MNVRVTPRSWARLVFILAMLVSAMARGDDHTHTPSLDDDVHLAVIPYDVPAVVEGQLLPFEQATRRLMPEVDLHVHLVTFDEMEAGIAENRFDLALTDPYHYLQLRETSSLTQAFAMIVRHSDEGPVTSMGSTAVTLADRDDLQSFKDLRRMRAALGDRRSASGFALPVAELHAAGVDRSDLRWLELGGDYEALQAVLAGQADVAFLRSGFIEPLARRGDLDLGRLKVLNRQNLADYPFAVSTKLVPEWPLVYLGGTRPHLMLRLLGLALQRPGRMEITTFGAVTGIVLAPSYQGFDNEMRALAIPPFDHAPNISLEQIWESHRTGVLAVAFAALIVVFLLVALAERNRRLQGVWRDLRNAHRSLEQDRRRLADLNRHFELFLDRTTDFIYFKDASRRYIFCSKAMARLSGHEDRHELEGKADMDLLPPEIAREYRDQEDSLFETGEAIVDMRQRYQREDGSTGWVSTYKWPVLSPDGKQVLGLFGISRDITLLHDHEQQLEQAAHYDSLTGLPNRSLLFDRLTQAMAAAERRETEIALVYLDLDHFKEVNDSLGHTAGDELLIRVAETMLSVLRRSDTVARIGGDEFVVLLGDLKSRKECMALLDRLLVAIAAPMTIAGEPVSVTASAGLAFFRGDMEFGPDRLLREADQAMYRAKEAGRNRYRLLDNTLPGEHEDLLGRLDHAIEHGEFELVYQPVVDMHSGAVLAAEALLRWRRDDETLLPDEFLPAVFGHPRAQELERWVLTQALEQQQRWAESDLKVRMHVNVTAAGVSREGFVEQLRNLMAELGAPTENALTLEILESAAVADSVEINALINSCREFGVGFALDDFGTAYSSLAHIKDVHAGCVKVDKRFVKSMYASHDDFSLLAAILAMARAFDRDVIAEGVESVEQGRMLVMLGCRVGQGYAIARPMNARRFLEWSREWQPDPSWQELTDAESSVLSEGWSQGRATWLEQRQLSAGS